MAHKRIASHIRMHRKRSGLTLRELARLVGHRSVGKVSRHERGLTIPTLPVAISYEAIFRVPIRELFPGVHETAAKNAEARLEDLELSLGRKSAKARDADVTARKLEFISARKHICKA